MTARQLLITVNTNTYYVLFFTVAKTHCGFVFCSPLAGCSLLAYEVSWSHTTTRHIRLDSSGRVISLSQRPLPDNTQHSQQTNIHAPSGIQTHDLSRRAALDLVLRQRGHWDRHLLRSIRQITRLNVSTTRWSSSSYSVHEDKIKIAS